MPKLDEFQVEMAEEAGRDNAATAYALPTTNNELIMQATLSGCKTKENILEFIRLAKRSAREQANIVRQVRSAQQKAQQIARLPQMKVGSTVNCKDGSGGTLGIVCAHTDNKITIEWPHVTTNYTIDEFTRLIQSGTFVIQTLVY